MKISTKILINLLNGGAVPLATGSRPSARHSSRSPASPLVELGHDGAAHLHDLLLLAQLVPVQPLDRLVALVVDGLLVRLGDLVLNLLIVDGGLHVEAVGLESIFGCNSLLLDLVLGLELLGIVDHPLDVLLGQPALVVGDRDLVLLPGGLVRSGYVEDSIGVNVEGDLNLWNTPWRWWDARQVELAQEVVVLGHGPLALVHLDRHRGLVV